MTTATDWTATQLARLRERVRQLESDRRKKQIGEREYRSVRASFDLQERELLGKPS